eukprot:gnl/MRDRNA2_/MRDRNA2_133286_c0_seq1.p1 gnl/MRDRNA2_/MRDRNA2_133286_c0~~gnl/MRDRNA2_/MRDRNA2_133286_c0_seq1.p1  ORF type:complete len:501 (+),score=92.21 gnl/MRDRNA2_/MRDRNA2_133286_c0_seq1:120-1622(+)
MPCLALIFAFITTAEALDAQKSQFLVESTSLGTASSESGAPGTAGAAADIFSKENINMYTITLIPLGLITLIAAWTTRPRAEDNMTPEFKSFMWCYLSVWYIAVAADWLQGPYVYALYAAYGFPGIEIARLFVAGFGASMIFGTFVGNLADKWGRKKCCMLYCILYIASCMTKHFNSYWILMVGRVTGGIATSILFSCFESWMVFEHLKRGFSDKLLKYMFSMMFSGMYVMAILAGISAQVLVDAYPMHLVHKGSNFHMGGFNNPFDLSIICLALCLVMMAVMWDENHGSDNASGSSTGSGLIAAMYALFTNWRIASVGIVVSAFEGSMFAFVFNWTPALDSKVLPPPHGLIFALFMMACMCGASAFGLFGSNMRPLQMLIPNLVLAMAALGACAFAVSSGMPYKLQTCFFGFLVFEFCCGVYFPVIGTIKSQVVMEQNRATIYNLYRVPLNAVVCGLLLSNLSLGQAFSLCTALLFLSVAICVPMLWSGTSVEEKMGRK